MSTPTPATTPARADATLEDKYTLTEGMAFMTGIQALVRLPIEQRRRDRAAGHNTAGYVSGYQGSPLAAIDGALRRAQPYLDAHDIVFRPGVNEELAMTAVAGTQYVGMFPGARVDGVFGIWYGKGPGVDRSVDALRHANWAGTSRLGGMLALAGDDHGAKSSTVACYSDIVFESCGMPVLYPATVQEILDFGLHGLAMSRFASVCVGMKLVMDIVESAAPVVLSPTQPDIRTPEFAFPADGLEIRPYELALMPVEERLYHQRLYAALAYIRANALNRITFASPGATIGIVSAGKSYQDVRKALHAIGLDEARAAELGVRVLKLGVVWPVEPQIVREFAQGLQTVVVVEEKRPLIENQIRSILYGQPAAPRVMGKVREGHLHDAQPRWLFPNAGELTASMVAGVIADLLKSRAPELAARVPGARALERPVAPPIARTPSFCSGCPHNRSTKLPEGSRTLAGIGCHGMQIFLDPENCKTVAQMGGEGMHWMGQQPFTSEQHVFANLGDGTYAHSGSLAIRQAVAFGVPITYKLLVNGFVSMTGGQAIAGGQSIAGMVESLRAEGVQRIVVVTDDPDKYEGVTLAGNTPIEHRSRLDAIQRELREYRGVSVLIYEQPCATERRRLRKKGQWADPPKRSFINSAVCEGCGDCGKVSTCLSIEPLETEFGRKRRINQSSCNKDFSCVEGFCPSFVTVHGGQLRKPGQGAAQGVAPGAGAEARAEAAGAQALLPFEVPEPVRPPAVGPFGVLVGGIGGTGVVTVGQVLAMAAHIDGTACLSLDVMGMAQKYGAVYSHLSFADDPAALTAPRLGAGEADTLIGCDLIVGTGAEPLATLARGRSHAVLCADLSATSEFARNADWSASPEALADRVRVAVGDAALRLVDGQRLAMGLIGDAIAINLMMVGVAWQLGRLPLSRQAIERAIELNGVQVAMNLTAFAWGRCIAHEPQRVESLLAGHTSGQQPGAQIITLHRNPADLPIDELIARRVAGLADYQKSAVLAQRYKALIERVRAADPAPRGRPAITRAAAAGLYKLMAVKDEWEVARLYTSEAFQRELAQTFEGDYQLHFHIGAWPFARRDPDTGRMTKREVGPWLMKAFTVLARLRGLRGTWLDPFRNSVERKLDRDLLARYEADLERMVQALDGDKTGDLRGQRYDTLVALASWPQKVRGFGHVREAQAELALQERERLLAALGAQDAPLEAHASASESPRPARGLAELAH